jgi:predicted ATP-grasp superfamily ATP-dependent carboligase
VSSKKILVLRGGTRNGLAVVRSLGSKGHTCDITTNQATGIAAFLRLQTLLTSRFVRRDYILPSATRDENIFLKELINLLKTERYDYLITAGTATYNIASRHKQELSKYTKPLVEDYAKVWAVHNKANCMNLSRSLGVPIPKTYIIKNYKDLEVAAANIDCQVIMKYPDSYSSKGIWKFNGGGKRLIDEYIKRNPNISSNITTTDFPLIQECVEGPLVDVTAFSINGSPIALLTQERLLTSWLDGGGGIVNITNDIKVIKEYATKILSKIKWTGPIELDWIRDNRTGGYKLLEINPKFWGTTQLTISAGYDFPAWIVDYAEGKEIKVPKSYKTRLMYRLMADEIYTILTFSKTKSSFLREVLKFFRRFTYRPVITDIWLRDLNPFILRSFVLSTILLSRFLNGIKKTLFLKV